MVSCHLASTLVLYLHGTLSSEAEYMKLAMEELLYEYGVDFVFNGHVHAYERSNRVYNYRLDPCGSVHITVNRVYNYTLDPCGPVYITVGDGGNHEKLAIPHADEPGKCPEPSSTPDKFMGGFCAYNFTSGPAAGNFCWDQQPEYSAYRESSFGRGILEVHGGPTWHRSVFLYKRERTCQVPINQNNVPPRLWSSG